ncbi:MAG: phosphate ABC transporter permease subunit PstC [Oscillospiraceae bacterium]
MKDLSSTIIKENNKSARKENIVKSLFFLSALTSILVVVSITFYMLYIGAPSIFKVGVIDFLFGSTWAPTAENPQFGILSIIATSITGTILSVIIGVPVAILTAVYLSQIASKKIYNYIYPVIEILSGIPSVIYGLIGVITIVPFIGSIEILIFKNSEKHQFTGGASLISAVIILAIMILPTIVIVSNVALRSVDKTYKEASLALGATKIQTIFKIIIPSSKSGIMAGVVLGISRAIGEAMAIMMVSGNSVNWPYPFNSVRFLTTGIVSEMSYSTGLHREVLFGIGLVLFAFIMIINIILNKILKKGSDYDK